MNLENFATLMPNPNREDTSSAHKKKENSSLKNIPAQFDRKPTVQISDAQVYHHVVEENMSKADMLELQNKLDFLEK